MQPALDDALMQQLMLQPKSTVFRFFYARGWVTLWINTTLPGVDIPPYLRSEINLSVRVGAKLPLPTVGIRVGSQGIKSTLFFSGKPYPCIFSWESIQAIIGEEEVGIAWADTKIFLIRKKITKPPLTVLDGGLDTNGCDEDVELAAQARREQLYLVKNNLWKSN